MKLRTFFPLFWLLLATATILPAQTFTKMYKDPIWNTQFAAVKKFDHAYYACGYTSSPSDGIYFGDFSKIDLNGNLLWTVRPMGEAPCRFIDFERTGSGDFILVGRTEPSTNLQGLPRNNQTVVCKVSSTGAVVFAQKNEFSPNGREGIWSIRHDADATDTYFLSGHTNGYDDAPSHADKVLLAEMDENGVFLRASQFKTSVTGATTDDEFFKKIIQPNTPSGHMWMCGTRRNVGSNTTYGIVTGVEEAEHGAVMSTLFEAGTAIADILTEPASPFMRILGVGQKDGEAIFFSYYPQAINGFIWSVKVPGQQEFLKIVPSDIPGQYFVLGRTMLGDLTKYILNHFDATGSSPVLIRSIIFDQGESSFTEAGICNGGSGNAVYFDTRLDNPGGVGKEVFMCNFNNLQSNCLAQNLEFTAQSIELDRNFLEISMEEIDQPIITNAQPGLASYAQRELCNDGCSPDCTTNAINISSGAGISWGQHDAKWMLIQSPISNMTLPRPANVVSYCWACGWGFQSTSKWISAHPDSWFWDNNPFPSSAYVFENQFCTCEANATIHFELSVMVDDSARVDLYDGNGNFIQNLLYANSKNTAATVSTDVFLPNAGAYSIRISMRNLGNVALGVNIEGTISGDDLSLPECCRKNNLIFGTKYSDENGNANRNYNPNSSPAVYEPGLPNWEIQLCDQSGNHLQSVFTDDAGLYMFNNVAPGDYLLKEVNQQGWTQTQPGGSGYYSVTVDDGSLIGNRNFGNQATSGTSTTAVHSNAKIRLTPNPASDQFLLELDGQTAEVSVTIMDIMGKLQQSILLPQGQSQALISVNHLPKGIYLVYAQLVTGEIVVEQLVRL